MNSITISAITFGCVMTGGVAGLLIKNRLPDHHLSPDSKDVVKLGAGLIATLAALVLGLLVSSAKTQFDSVNEELREGAASRINLDRILAQYGPETKAARDDLREALKHRIEHLWPKDGRILEGLKAEESSTEMEKVGGILRGLVPQNESQQFLKSRALAVYAEGMERRWSLLLKVHAPVPIAFVVVLVFWFTVLFVMFGLLSPGNATVMVVQFICALSIAGGVFLVLEMNRPFEGVVNISSAPLEDALRNMGQ